METMNSVSNGYCRFCVLVLQSMRKVFPNDNKYAGGTNKSNLFNLNLLCFKYQPTKNTVYIFYCMFFYHVPSGTWENV